jgi:hypothetical protein
MRRYLPLGLLLAVLAHLSGCGENPNRPSVVAETPVNPPKTSARFIQVPWDISLFFNIPGGAVVAGATTAATSGNAAAGDNLTGTFVNSNGFAGTLTGVLTGNLESGNFDGTLSTVTPSGCTAERRFSGPLNTQALNWSPGPQVNDCGGTSPLTSGIQAAAAPPTAPPPCTYAATATGTSVPAAGGTGTVTVTAGTGCNWFATSSAGFVTLSASQGSANGSVQFTVAANTATTQRTATLVVAGQSFTITQAAAPAPVCNYRLNGGERTVDANGLLGGVDMRVAAGCAWQAQSDAPWLTITGGASGSGDGTISYAVAANPGLTPRIGTITATGDQDFTVTQLGIVCQFTLTPSTTAVPFSGGNGTIQVAPNAAVCPWTATVSPGAPWITLTPPAGGTGQGSVAFTVAPNAGAARTATITVAGQSATINQAQSPVGIVSGTVTNNLNGQPIAGATVAIGNLTATTATNGTYSIGNVLLGPQTVRVTAPEFIARSDQITVTFQTTHNAVLTAAAPALTFTFNPPTAVVNPANQHCGQDTASFCWFFETTLQNTGGATLSVSSFEINLFDTAGVQTQNNVYDGAGFANFYRGSTSVPANGSTVGNIGVFFDNPSGGTIELIVAGVDVFGRQYRFVSVPRLTAAPFQTSPGPALQGAPTGAPVTAPAPRPVPGAGITNSIRR